MTALMRLGLGREIMHESDKSRYPERHWLFKDSYSKYEAQELCIYCCDHYEWDKKMFYDVRTDRFYKIKSEKKNNAIL